LGWKEVPAFVLDMNDVDRGLWEIDENLIRAELTELERAEHIKQRKVLYLLKHPETKHGGDHGNQHTGGKKRERQVANVGDLVTPVCFVKDTAVKTGMSEREVQRAVRRAEAIDGPRSLDDAGRRSRADLPPPVDVQVRRVRHSQTRGPAKGTSDGSVSPLVLPIQG